MATDDYTKQSIAEELKSLVRYHLAPRIDRKPGLSVEKIDTVDNLAAHVVIKQGAVTRIFKIKISEVMTNGEQ